MLPYRDTRLTKIVIGLFFLVLSGYAFFELRGFLWGPRISLPQDIIQSHEQFITLTGRADRIASLNMNGSPITVTEDGSFAEPYLLSSGLNQVVFDASDKYGRTSRAVLQVVYTAPEGSEAEATSTLDALSPSDTATSSPQE